MDATGPDAKELDTKGSDAKEPDAYCILRERPVLFCAVRLVAHISNGCKSRICPAVGCIAAPDVLEYQRNICSI